MHGLLCDIEQASDGCGVHWFHPVHAPVHLPNTTVAASFLFRSGEEKRRAVVGCESVRRKAGPKPPSYTAVRPVPQTQAIAIQVSSIKFAHLRSSFYFYLLMRAPSLSLSLPARVRAATSRFQAKFARCRLSPCKRDLPGVAASESYGIPHAIHPLLT